MYLFIFHSKWRLFADRAPKLMYVKLNNVQRIFVKALLQIFNTIMLEFQNCTSLTLNLNWSLEVIVWRSDICTTFSDRLQLSA